MTSHPMPHPRRRLFIRTGTLALALAATFGSAVAQESYPSKPIKVIVPFAAGGGSDNAMRMVASVMSRHLGQSVIVDNKGGAGGNVGVNAAAKSPADGYTIVMLAQSASANPFLYKNLPFDVVKDLVPVGLMVKYYEVLVVNMNSPTKSLQDLLARAKAKPGSVSFGTSGAGGLSHIAAEHLAQMAGVKMLHVPYKGVGPALTALLAGQIDMMFDIPSTSVPQIEAGKLRALGVTSPKRLANMPNVPAVAESLPSMSLTGWLGLAAPAATPPDRVARLTAALDQAMKDPQVRDSLTKQGYDVPDSVTAKAFDDLIKTDLAFYGKFLPSIGLQPE